ncbi:MAG: EAL domain-containing protein [Lachnospiraceae bacterium]|nr:EAL domain-containing protein [Lachnospiraceae bacterium]
MEEINLNKGPISDTEPVIIDSVSSTDILLRTLNVANSWEYDISSHSMHCFFFDSETKQPKEVIIKDFRNTIKEMNLIFSEDKEIFDAFCDMLDSGREAITTEYRAISKDYKQVWFRHEAHAIKEKNGDISKVIGRRFDITAEKEQTEPAFRFEAGEGLVEDKLTGLLHRLKAKSLIEKELANKKIDMMNELVGALILIDFDNFGRINETYGRMYGDIVIQTVAGIIYTNFMTKDIVTRITGDQFMVFCNGIEEHKTNELIYELQVRIRNNVTLRDGKKITASIGYAFAPKDGISFYSVYGSADIALKNAKERGGNCAIAFDPKSMHPSEPGMTMIKKSWHIGTDNEKESKKTSVNKKLFDFAFDTLTNTQNTSDAVCTIFKELSLHYGYDRAVLYEPAVNGSGLMVTVKWSRYKDDPDYDEEEILSHQYWNVTPDDYTDGCYLIFENGRSGRFDFYREVSRLKNPAVTAMQLPIFDDDVVKAMIFFECFEHHDFKSSEIDTVSSVIQLISGYRLSQQVKSFMEAESIINKNVMDVQRVVYFVIDETTKEIRYLSRQARKAYPGVEYGKKYYEAIIGTKLEKALDEMDYGRSGEKTIEYYDEINDRWYTVTASKMKDAANSNDTLVCITDVTEFLKRVKSEDSLTVAETFDSFVVTATNLIKNKDNSYQIVCCGIKEFSKINDEFGYVAGDEILKEYAQRIHNRLKDGELLCRIKGDDFLMLLHKDDLRDYRKMVVYCSDRMTEEFRMQYPGIEIHCFAGSYDIPKEEGYINRCIDNALKARNAALNDREEYYFKYTHDIEIKEQEEAKLQNRMKKALTSGGFKVYFQPKVDIDNEKIIGAEALVRLEGDDGRLISPGLFIPLAEKNGMVVDIDNKVYEQTFSYMSRWIKEGKNVPLISVNVSRMHLLDDELPVKMKALIEKHSLMTDQVELEITESVFFEDTERLIDMIRRLKEAGFSISMDDFGSGYSTLNFMKELPVDVIKIDGGFFMKNKMDEKSKVVISAIMQLTRNLNFESVSEGVETQEQVDFLKEQGGHCVQGYYYYKPMPAEEFESLLA